MNKTELIKLIDLGETSRVQFKEKISSPDKLTAEMVAFSNSKGGLIIIGVKDKTSKIVGLSPDEIRKISSLAGNIATNKIYSPIFIETEAISVNVLEKDLLVLIIEVKEGINKPHKDKNGVIWVKQGADKRKVTDNNEILRLFNQGGNLLPDEMPVKFSNYNEVNKDSFNKYFEKKIGYSFEESEINLEKALKNMAILRDDNLTLAGLLFFAKDPQKYKPVFCVKAVSYFGNDLSGDKYRDSRNIEGTIPEMFKETMSFLSANLRHIQKDKNFNSLGDLEVSKIALEEIIQNALVHRDYLISSSIKVFIFDNRIEILSPGKLPNSLTIDQIKYGTSIARNQILAGFCSYTMKYRGIGSGISRAIKEQPNIEIINDIEREEFKVIIRRKSYIIPVINENGGINGGIKEEINEGVKSLIEMIAKYPGANLRRLSEKLDNRSTRTIEKQIKKAKDKNLIEHRGSNKTGGYWIIFEK